MAPKSQLEEILKLADLHRPAWDDITAGIPAWHPRNEGNPDPEPGKGDPDPDPGKGDPDPDPDPEPGKEPDWKAEARKHERRAKQERAKREAAEAALAEKDDATKTERQKEIDDARKAAREEALTEAQQERRKDRLELAVTRLAAKTFADTEDALLHVERAIAAGDIDADDIYDDQGKVQTTALQTALDELLERKPHLKANRVAGDADAGKGSGAKDLESLGVEGHLKQVQARP